MRGVARGILWEREGATSLCLKIGTSAAELRIRVCYNKPLSLAKGARLCFALKHSLRRRSPSFAGNGLSLGCGENMALTRAMLSVAGNICYVKALQEAKAWRFKSSQPGCQLRRAAEDSNRFYAILSQLNSPKRPETGFQPAQTLQLFQPRSQIQ